MEREHEHVREHLTGREHRDCESDPTPDAQPVVRAWIDQQDPDECGREHPARVLEIVQPRVDNRVDVETWDVPERKIRSPERERNARAKEEREHGPHVAVTGDRTESTRRQHEHEERSAECDDHQRDPEVADQHMLEHVHPEEVVLADRVDW